LETGYGKYGWIKEQFFFHVPIGVIYRAVDASGMVSDETSEMVPSLI